MVTKDPEFTLRLMDQLLVKSLTHRECDRKTDECSATMYIGTLSHSVYTRMYIVHTDVGEKAIGQQRLDRSTDSTDFWIHCHCCYGMDTLPFLRRECISQKKTAFSIFSHFDLSDVLEMVQIGDFRSGERV